MNNIIQMAIVIAYVIGILALLILTSMDKDKLNFKIFNLENRCDSLIIINNLYYKLNITILERNNSLEELYDSLNVVYSERLELR